MWKKKEILGKIIGIRTSSYKYWRSRDDPKQNISLFHLHEDPKEEKNIVDIGVNSDIFITQGFIASNAQKETVLFADEIKALGFNYAYKAGISPHQKLHPTCHSEGHPL